MSIPKEPRQLMINIMYLVLTAMLALNVSAEIFNAFRVVKKGLDQSNVKLDEVNKNLPEAIQKNAKKDPKYAPYAQKATQVAGVDVDLVNLINSVEEQMIKETKGYDEKTGHLKGEKDKDVTSRVLIGKDAGANNGKGAEIEKLILSTRTKFLDLIDEKDRATFEANLPLNIDESWKKSDKKNWAQFNFYHMPLGAALPILAKIKNDAKSSEAAVLNYLSNKVGGDDIVFNKFKIVTSPKSSYVIKGDKYETELFLSAMTSNVQGLSISVNGSNLPIKDGVATWSTTPANPGISRYKAVANIKNPVTGEVTTATGDFEFEVGTRSATVSADKMNVFYIGVDNPISVSAAGVSSNDLKVNGTGGGISLRPTDKGKYVVTVKSEGNATISLNAPGLPPTNFPFRVKRIPDPVPMIGTINGGTMGNGEFKVQDGLRAVLQNFDFEAKCSIVSYELNYQAKRQDVQSVPNQGAAFNSQAKAMVGQAKPGDAYYFMAIKGRCPGDDNNRNLPQVVIKIK